MLWMLSNKVLDRISYGGLLKVYRNDNCTGRGIVRGFPNYIFLRIGVLRIQNLLYYQRRYPRHQDFVVVVFFACRSLFQL